MDKITTTIKRQWYADIVAGRKRVEYREIKPYWTRKLEAVSTPFLLRLINGMSPNAPEVMVVVREIRRNSRRQCYELHLGSIRSVKNWDRQREQPKLHFGKKSSG